MPNLLTFDTLAEALRRGYQIYERTTSGYLLRARTTYGWSLAKVVLDHG